MSVSTEIRIHIFHTGRVCVSPALPFIYHGQGDTYRQCHCAGAEGHSQ